MSKRSRSEPAEQVQSPVRRRLENSLFDTLDDEEITLDEIVSGVVRMLNYDPHDGLLEVLNLVVRAAGCATPMQLLAPATAASDLETAVGTYAPAQYPLKNKSGFSRRYTDFFAALPAGVLAGDALAMAARLVAYLVPLSELQTRSVRHAASAAALCFARSLPHLLESLDDAEKSRRTRTADAAAAHRDKLAELVAPLIALARARQTDVFAPVREQAVAALAALEPRRLVASLNDSTVSVRVAALRGVAPAGRDWRRVLEIAEADCDPKCRKQALVLLTESTEGSDALNAARAGAVQLVRDADAGVRQAAAQLVVGIAAQPQPQFAAYGLASRWPLLLEIASLAPPPQAAESIARAAGCGFDPLANLLVFDWSTLEVTTADTQWLAATTPAANVRCALLDMLLGFGRHEWAEIQKQPLESRREKTDFFVAEVLAALPALVSGHSHADTLLARAIRIGILLDVTAVLRRGLEREYEAFLEQVLEMFHAHPSREVLAAVSEVFAVAGADESPFAGALRLRLADELETVAEVDAAGGPAQLVAKARQATVLAPFVDLAPLRYAPFWESQDPAVVTLAGRLGLAEDPAAVQLAVQYLLSVKTPQAVQELLTVHVVAAMRKTQLEPLPELSREGVAEPVLAAARAAGV